MDFLDDTITDLKAGAAFIEAAVAGLGAEELRAKPEGGGWSMLEVLHHLWDEEREDFPLRLRLTLQDPLAEWPPIDPEGWAISRNYNAASPVGVLAGFLAEREKNLEWLQALEQPDWDLAHSHPRAGAISARQLALSWRAHDLLHGRQLLRLRYGRLQAQRRSDSDLDYAGSW